MTSTDQEDRRRKLVPKWIRVFCWIFLVMGAFTPLLLLAGLFYKAPMQFAVFGWERSGSPYQLFSLVVEAYFIGSGAAAFGLLRGKAWGLAAGMVVGIIGLALSLGSLVVHPLVVSNGDSYSINLRIEPLLQLPYLYALWRIRHAWNSGDGESRNAVGRMGTEVFLVAGVLAGIACVLILHATSNRASGAVAGKPHFEDLVASDSKFGDAVDAFSTTAPMIYVHGRKSAIGSGSTIRVTWIAVETNGASPNYTFFDKNFVDELPANATMYFSMSKPTKGWPVGTYRLDLSIEGKPVGSAAFVVRAD